MATIRHSFMHTCFSVFFFKAILISYKLLAITVKCLTAPYSVYASSQRGSFTRRRNGEKILLEVTSGATGRVNS